MSEVVVFCLSFCLSFAVSSFLAEALSLRWEQRFIALRGGEQKRSWKDWGVYVELAVEAVDRLGKVLEVLLRADQIELRRTEKLLRRAGFRVSAARFMGCRVLISFAAGAACYAVFCWIRGKSDAWGLFTLAGGVAVYLLAEVFLRSRAREREAEVAASIPGFLDFLILGIEAGKPVSEAIRDVRLEIRQLAPQLAQDLDEMITAMDSGGMSFREAVQAWASKYEAMEIHSFARVVVRADDLGQDLAFMLGAYAEAARKQLEDRLRQQLATLPLKLIAPLALVFLGVMSLVAGPLILELMRELGAMR